MNILTARPHRLLRAVIARIGQAAQEGQRCMLLVPAQFTLQAEIEVMTQLDIKGTFLIDVLSPERLRGRVFERAGQPDRVIFDERGKRMVLSEIVEQEKEQLTVYRSAAEHGALGLVEKLSALIADLKRSGKTAQDVVDALAAMDDAQRAAPTARKLADAARLYAAYEQRMAGMLCDAEDVSREMCARLARSGVLSGQRVFVYGFDMITPAFAAELVEMAKLADALTLAVETDENGAPDGRLFAPVNLSIERLRALAGEAGVPLAWERLDAGLDAPDDIRCMERRLFALGGAPEADAPAHIELHAVSSMRQEVHLAGSRMRRMMAQGADTAQMAVVYPRASGYAPLLGSILPLYGVQVYVAEKRPAGAHPLCRFLLASLAVVSGGWRASDVVEVVQSGFIDLSRADADALCAYIEGMDVRSSAFRRPFVYAKAGAEAELESLNAAREAVAKPLAAFQKALSRAQDARGTIEAVLALLDDVHACDTLEAMRADLMQAGLESEAEDCAQVWNRLMETLDQLYTLLGGSSAGPKVVLALLESGLTALELSALPPADGAVICGEIGNVRTGRVETLFALGMNDAAGAPAGGLFTPQEQEEAARATGAYLGMSLSERAALAQLDELKALTACRERLIVSYALADETGRALREGTAVQALRRLFPNMPVRGGLAQAERDAMLAAPDSALLALGVALSEAADGRGALTDAQAQAYAALNRSEAGREKLCTVTRALGDRAARRLTGSQARALYGRPVMSVSRLETFAQCPYRHFVRYGLAPQQPVEPGVDRAELGTLYHEAAERFSRALTAQPDFPHVGEAASEALMEEAVAPLIAAWRQSPLGESARGEAIARRIGRTARRAAKNIAAQFAQSRFAPMHFELAFGKNGVAPIALALPDGSFVYLQGRIDRIDVLDGQTQRIRVIDYKSGTKTFDPTMAYYGIQLQLLLYLAAALARTPEAQAAGFFYCRIADPTVRTESRIKEEVERQIAKKLALSGVSLSDVEVLRAQDARHAAMITRDGQPGGQYRGSMTDQDGMDAMVAFARRKAAQLAGEAYAGVIEDAPAAFGAYSACASCDYAAVCGFDPTTRRRRQLSKKALSDLR